MSASMWVELSVVCPRARADLVALALVEAGAQGTLEEDPPGEVRPPRQPWDDGPELPVPDRAVVRAWLPPEADSPALRAALHDAGALDVLTKDAADADWAETWKAHFARIDLGPFGVAPPWEAQPGDVVLEPGMAFGTGSHPTTRACLDAIVRLAAPKGTLLDVGCGSGVLALAGARLGMRARGIDNDPEAVATTRDNARTNNLDVDVDGTPLESVAGTFDIVVANVFAEVLVAMAPHLIARTGRHLVLAGILTEREGPVVRAFDGPLRPVLRRQEEDWTHLIYEARG